MTADFKNKFELSVLRRSYYSHAVGLTSCPECGLPLIADDCTVLIAVKTKTDEGELMSNLSGSHFCNSCPVVVFDSGMINQAVRFGNIRGKQPRYSVVGIVDFNAIPEEKRHLEIGIDENPVPLVRFLPDLDKTLLSRKKKTGRNDPCSCGSGKKYKKCCGQ